MATLYPSLPAMPHPDIGYFHPQIVHFVIAGLGLGILFRWLSVTGKWPWTDRAATTLILLGTLASVFAVMSGTQTHELAERIPGVAAAVQAHEDAGHDVRNFFLVIAALEIAALIPALAKWRRWIIIASAVGCVWGAYDIFDAGQKGGVLVYSFAGGVGERSGDSVDVNFVVRSALYDRALLDRQQKNAGGASQEFEELARRFPNDAGIQLAAAQSLLEDKKDPAAAMAALGKIAVPPDTSRLFGRYQMARADAFVGLGQTDSARAILTAMAAKFPQSQRIKDKLAKLK
jgi:uncharacterized membrane protein